MKKIKREDIENLLILDNLNPNQKRFLKIMAKWPKVKKSHNEKVTQEEIEVAEIFQEISDEIEINDSKNKENK